jgi:hypothetical protein
MRFFAAGESVHHQRASLTNRLGFIPKRPRRPPCAIAMLRARRHPIHSCQFFTIRTPWRSVILSFGLLSTAARTAVRDVARPTRGMDSATSLDHLVGPREQRRGPRASPLAAFTLTIDLIRCAPTPPFDGRQPVLQRGPA